MVFNCANVLTLKDKAVQSVLKVLVSFKAAEIDGAVKDLDQTKLDLLMKYIYRGFEQCSDGNGYGAQLLIWHDKVQLCHFHLLSYINIAGIGDKFKFRLDFCKSRSCTCHIN
jgi:ARP2/3 complex 16 kDa subunit (p16-Arc)